MQKLRVFLAFYRPFFSTFTIISLVSCYIMWTQHTISGLFLFLCLKLFSTLVFFYLWYALRSRELYFYYNLGFRKRYLYGTVFLLDLLLFAGLVFITALLI